MTQNYPGSKFQTFKTFNIFSYHIPKTININFITLLSILTENGKIFNKLFLVIIIITLFPFFASAQPDQQTIFSIDELTSAIVFLEQNKPGPIKYQYHDNEYWVLFKKLDSGKFILVSNTISGTGFFVVNEQHHLFLVTAAHIAKEMSSMAKVILRGNKDKPILLNLTDLTGATTLLWKYNVKEDVAVLELHPSQIILKKYLQRRFMPVSLLESSMKAPDRNIPLTVIGFPLGLGIKKYFSPLTLQTYAASGLLQLPFNNGHLITVFCLENPAIGGYSGAPCFDVSIYTVGKVIKAIGGGTKCYGLVNETLSDQTGGKLAVVIPSKFIVNLIK